MNIEIPKENQIVYNILVHPTDQDLCVMNAEHVEYLPTGPSIIYNICYLDVVEYWKKSDNFGVQFIKKLCNTQRVLLPDCFYNEFVPNKDFIPFGDEDSDDELEKKKKIKYMMNQRRKRQDEKDKKKKKIERKNDDESDE